MNTNIMKEVPLDAHDNELLNNDVEIDRAGLGGEYTDTTFALRPLAHNCNLSATGSCLARSQPRSRWRQGARTGAPEHLKGPKPKKATRWRRISSICPFLPQPPLRWPPPISYATADR
jgi:hypothetical protein